MTEDRPTEAAFKRIGLPLLNEMFQWVLVGSLIILLVTTLLAKTGLGANLGEDEDVLFFLQVISLLASIVSAVGLMVTRKP